MEETGGFSEKGGAKSIPKEGMELANYVAELSAIGIPEEYAIMIYNEDATYTKERDVEGHLIIRVLDKNGKRIYVADMGKTQQ